MKLILWDFDGTLAYRDGMWSGTILSILRDVDEHLSHVSVDDIRPLLKAWYPWHEPEKAHRHIRDATEWWEWITPLFENVFRNLGCSSSVARECAKRVRPTYLDRKFWKMFPDVRNVLGDLSQQGWTNWILSNHVPELRDLVLDIGLGEIVSKVFTSALTGYEKPHPMAYRIALEEAASPETVWMVGDSLVADYQGARKNGIPSILVRNHAEGVEFFAENLWDAATILNSQRMAGA